jgi:hypothetical protein
MVAFPESDDEYESCDSDLDTEDSDSEVTAMTVATCDSDLDTEESDSEVTAMTVATMEMIWLFQMMKHTWTETQRDRSRMLLS